MKDSNGASAKFGLGTDAIEPARLLFQRAGIPEAIVMDDVPIEAMQVHALLRSGATLPEAMKLARHSDIKMTMKYTHIGMKH